MAKVVPRSGLVRNPLRRERFIPKQCHNKSPTKPGHLAILSPIKMRL